MLGVVIIAVVLAPVVTLATGLVISLVIAQEHKVGTCDARLVGEVQHDAPVAEKAPGALLEADVGVDICILKGGTGIRCAVLPAQIADLAGGRRLRVAGSSLAANEGIEMRQSLGAVAIFRDGIDVKVVAYNCISTLRIVLG